MPSIAVLRPDWRPPTSAPRRHEHPCPAQRWCSQCVAMQSPALQPLAVHHYHHWERRTVLDSLPCQAKEQHRPLHCPALFEVGGEESGRLHVHPHDPKDGSELLLVGIPDVLDLELDEGGLTGNLAGHLVVGEAGREEGDLVAARDGAHDVDGRHASLDHGLGVVTGGGVDGHAVDAKGDLRQHLGGGY